MTSGHLQDPVWAVADVRLELACRYGKDLRLLWVNCAYANAYGQDRADKSLLDDIPAADHVEFVSKLKAITADLPRMSIRYRPDGPKGGGRWEAWTHHGVFDGDGNIVEYHAVGRDVTGEVVDHERRLAAEDRLRRAVAATGLGTWEHSLSAQIDTFDARALQILGFPRDTPSDRVAVWTERVHPRSDLARVVAPVGEGCRRRSALGHCGSRVRGEAGSWIWVHSVAIDRYDDKIVGILSDVTDRRRTEDRLRESERRLQFALQAAGEGLWDLDLSSNRMELSERSADGAGPWRDLAGRWLARHGP